MCLCAVATFENFLGVDITINATGLIGKWLKRHSYTYCHLHWIVLIKAAVSVQISNRRRQACFVWILLPAEVVKLFCTYNAAHIVAYSKSLLLMQLTQEHIEVISCNLASFIQVSLFFPVYLNVTHDPPWLMCRGTKAELQYHTFETYHYCYEWLTADT